MNLRSHPLPRPLLTVLVLLPACFDPRVTDDVASGTEQGTTAAVDSEVGTTTGQTTAIEPDSSSGAPPTVCGDGVVEGAEVCDDGVNNGSYGGCAPGCRARGPFCGDGQLNGAEPCDDGDDVDGNGCNVDCVISGTLLWAVTYDGPAHDQDMADGVAVDSNDDIIVAGTVSTNDGQAAWVRKYTAQGGAAWTQFFPAMLLQSSLASSVVVLENGGSVFGGYFYPQPSGSQPDAWIRGITGLGDPLWTATHTSPQDGLDQVRDLEVDDAGYLYALIRETPVPSTDRYFLRKFTSEGAELWTLFLDEEVSVGALATAPNGSCVMVGATPSGGAWIPWIARYTSDGAEVWSYDLPEHFDAFLLEVDINSNDEILTWLDSADSSDRVVKFDASGGIVDEHYPHVGEAFVNTRDLLIMDDGQYVLAGIAGDDGHLWISKYSPEGNELWTYTYNGEEWGWGLDIVTALDTDSMGNIIAVGSIQDHEATKSDIWTAKFAP